MLNYKRLVQIDDEVIKLDRFREKILFTPNSSIAINIEINKGKYINWLSDNFEVTKEWALDNLQDRIDKLKEEKCNILGLNKKWYQFWK